MNLDKKLPIPDYPSLHEWEDYSATLGVEYMQCIEEGLDIAAYKDLFYAVMTLPKDEVRKKLADVLYEIVMNAPIRADYPYQEPSDLEGILKLRESAPELPAFDADRLPDQVLGAWMGRICGCMLGKSVEGVRTSELHPFLKATGNFPMHRYILKTDLDAVDLTQYKFNFSWPPMPMKSTACRWMMIPIMWCWPRKSSKNTAVILPPRIWPMPGWICSPKTPTARQNALPSVIL